MKLLRSFASGLICAASVIAPGSALAQDWPAKAVRIIVPFPPGGPLDVVARAFAQRFGGKYSQPFVVENRPGAGGNIGTEAMAKATPDGYAFGLTSNGPLANNRYLYKTMPFDAQRDLTPIVLVAEIPVIAVANPKVPARDLRELAALARTRAGRLNAGSSGNGTVSHLTLEMFKTLAKLDVLHVPYKGGGINIAELLSGSVDFLFDPVTSYARHVQAGTLRGLAVTTKARLPALPEVPTAIEQGYDLEASIWFAAVGPAGMPRAIVERLNQDINQYIGSPEGRARLVEFGAQVIGGPPERVAAMIESDSGKWKRIIELSGARMD